MLTNTMKAEVLFVSEDELRKTICSVICDDLLKDTDLLNKIVSGKIVAPYSFLDSIDTLINGILKDGSDIGDKVADKFLVAHQFATGIFIVCRDKSIKLWFWCHDIKEELFEPKI